MTNRIEVLDLDTLERAILIDTGANSIPQGIAVDPQTRYQVLVFLLVANNVFNE